MTDQDVIVVGAGLAGLTCARRLHHAGYQVSLLEKSRGVGGRLATRRLDGMPLDHGARYLTVASPRWQWLIDRWLAEQLIVPWRPQSYGLGAGRTLRDRPLTAMLYAAPAGMNAVGKELAEGLMIHHHQRVINLSTSSDPRWTITTQRAADQTTGQFRAKAIVMALPAPQIVPMLSSLGTWAPIKTVTKALETVSYAPMITVMAQYANALTQPADPLPCAAAAPWMVEGQADTALFWVGLDSSKRSLDRINVVIHSSAAFARDWLEATDLQPAGEALLAHASQRVADWLARPHHWQVHRWRYAFVERPCEQPMPMATTPLPLITCGDWCGKAHLDSALEAGWRAAATLHNAMGGADLPEFPHGLLAAVD